MFRLGYIFSANWCRTGLRWLWAFVNGGGIRTGKSQTLEQQLLVQWAMERPRTRLVGWMQQQQSWMCERITSRPHGEYQLHLFSSPRANRHWRDATVDSSSLPNSRCLLLSGKSGSIPLLCLAVLKTKRLSSRAPFTNSSVSQCRRTLTCLENTIKPLRLRRPQSVSQWARSPLTSSSRPHCKYL